jgi:hypothetical protein
MSKTRWLAVVFLPLLLVSFLHAQSVVELAKKEKERRAALKGKPVTVITAADIAKVKKRPAVETISPDETGEEAAGEAGGAETQAQTQEGAAPPAGAQGDAAAEAQPQNPVETLPDLQNPAPSAKEVQAKLAELTKAAQDKQDLTDLLTLKLNSLYQEFYTLDNLKSRELLQAQISDTYDKLLQAQLDATNAAKELENYMAQAQKDKTPTIWIK